MENWRHNLHAATRGFVIFLKKRKCAKFVKSLYGLEQAPKQCREKFDQIKLTNRFKVN